MDETGVWRARGILIGVCMRDISTKNGEVVLICRIVYCLVYCLNLDLN